MGGGGVRCDIEPLTLFTDVGHQSIKWSSPPIATARTQHQHQAQSCPQSSRHGHVHKTCLASIAYKQAIIARLLIIKSILQRQHKTPTFSGGPDMSFTNM